MSQTTHFCDLNSPDKLKEAIVDHPKLRALCRDAGIKRLRQYLAYINPDRKVEIAIITSEIESKIEDRLVRRSRMTLAIAIIAAIAAIASATAAWFSYVSSKSPRLGTPATASEVMNKKEPNQTVTQRGQLSVIDRSSGGSGSAEIGPRGSP